MTAQLGTHWESVVHNISYTVLLIQLMMYRLIFVFLLASTLGADLTGLLEQLSQRERGKYRFDVQSVASCC